MPFSENKNSALSTQHSALILLILLHLAIALPLAYILNIWIDEASTLYTTKNGFFYALQNSAAIEKQAPLYFWILSLWRDISDSVFFARLFSVIFSVLAIFFFHRLVRKFFDEKMAIFVTAFFAFHPFLFWMSLEIRLYSVVVFLSVLILYLFFETFFWRENEKTEKHKEILFVIVSIAALYTNYYLGFLLVGCFFSLLILRKWKAGKSYFLLMLVAGLFFLPLLFAVKSQFAVNSSGFQFEKSLAEGLRLFWNYFLSFILPTEIFPSASSSAETSTISFFRLWIVRLTILAAIVLLVKRRKIFDEKILTLGTICLTTVAFLLAAYFALGPVYVAIRHAAVLFVPTILFAAIIAKEILPQESIENSERKNNLILVNLFKISFAILIASFFVYSLFNLYPNFSKRGDWSRVAEFVKANEKPSQPIIIFPNYDALALPIYYTGANEILPDEKFFDWEFEAAPGSELSATKQTDFIISEIPPEAKEVWLLTDESCEISEQCRPLENFIEANYTTIETKYFYLEKLRLLKKK